MVIVFIVFFVIFVWYFVFIMVEMVCICVWKLLLTMRIFLVMVLFFFVVWWLGCFVLCLVEICLVIYDW